MTMDWRNLLNTLSKDLKGIDLSLIKDLSSSPNLKEEMYEACRDRAIYHPEWSTLAGRVKMFFIKKDAPLTFSESVEEEMKYDLLEPNYYQFVMANRDKLDSLIDGTRDWKFNDFAVGTLCQSYLFKVSVPTDEKDENGNVIWRKRFLETPQYMYLRVATFIYFIKDDPRCFHNIKKCYESQSKGDYTHASPTLFNAGRKRHNLASCFLMSSEDSLHSIQKSWTGAAEISKNSGGIGISYASLRHSEIAQQGTSGGITRWAKIMNAILCAVDQGGLRKGSGTVYIEPWHIDTPEFLDLRKNNGPEDLRARDLFYALWIPDLFMERVKKDDKWTLMCPNIVLKSMKIDLTKIWGKEFEEAYVKCEEANLRNSKIVKARDIWERIVNSQIETGMPFMLYKDACNKKSNQQNLGTIKCSNLCVEIVQFSSDEEISSCNLASIALNSCVEFSKLRGRDYFNFTKLIELSKELVRNLNCVIDRNYYPESMPSIRYSNFRSRPIGIGVQGLADVFAMLDLCWDSEEARTLNKDIAEAIYFGAMSESVEMAKRLGHYETFPGSPASEGKFQFDLWDVKPELNPNYDWETLRSDMIRFGSRNSLLVANMPTASSASILGNNESIEPFTQTNYARTTLSGQYVMTNKHMVKDLEDLDWWNTEVVKSLLENQGSISSIPLPGEIEGESDINRVRDERVRYLKRKYKNVFEIPQKLLSDFNLDRGPFVDQSQSFNCWMVKPTSAKLTSFHFYNWEKGAKTGMYYLRQTARTNPINFALNSLNIPVTHKTIDVEAIKKLSEECVSCSS